MASIESLRISFFSINWFKFITLLTSFVSKAKIRPTLEFCPVFVSKLLRWTLMFFSYPWNFPCTVTPSTPGFTHLDVGAPDDGDSPHNNRSTRTVPLSLQSQFVLTKEEDTEPPPCPCFLQNHRGSGCLSLSSHPGSVPNPECGFGSDKPGVVSCLCHLPALWIWEN